MWCTPWTETSPWEERKRTRGEGGGGKEGFRKKRGKEKWLQEKLNFVFVRHVGRSKLYKMTFISVLVLNKKFPLCITTVMSIERRGSCEGMERSSRSFRGNKRKVWVLVGTERPEVDFLNNFGFKSELSLVCLYHLRWILEILWYSLSTTHHYACLPSIIAVLLCLILS